MIAIVGLLFIFFVPIVSYSNCQPGAKCYAPIKGPISLYVFGLGAYLNNDGYYNFEIPGYGSIPLNY